MAPKKKKLGTGVVAGGKRKKIAKAKANVEPDTDSTTDAQTEPPRSPTPSKGHSNNISTSPRTIHVDVHGGRPRDWNRDPDEVDRSQKEGQRLVIDTIN
jgi:hypothetical protein